MTPEIPRLLTPAETAALLGIKPATLAVWRCTGRYPLQYVKIGKLAMYRELDVHQFIETRLHRHTGDDSQ